MSHTAPTRTSFDDMDDLWRADIPPYIFFPVIFVLVLVHVWWCVRSHSGAPWGACGNDIAVFGGITALRPILRLSFDERYHGVRRPDEIKQIKKDRAALLSGAAMTIVGALINGYAFMFDPLWLAIGKSMGL